MFKKYYFMNFFLVFNVMVSWECLVFLGRSVKGN